MINPAFNYAFVDYNEKEQVIHGHEVINRNGWVGATTYYRYDGVTYDGDDFICLNTNSNVIPGTDPTVWSYLVQIEGETVVPQAGSDYIARSLGSLAYNTALDAYELAQTGTNLIIAETGSRIAADQAIVSFVFGSIAVDLTAETGSRIAADYAEAGTRSEADQYLQNLIVAESGSRIAGEQALVSFVFGSIAVDLQHETGSRIAADAAEAGTRSSRDQYLQNLIVAESGSRIAGEQALVQFVFGSIAVDLTAETGSRIAADAAEANIRSQTDIYLLNLASAGTVPPPLSTLPDVSIPAPSANQVLSFDGSKWVTADTPSQVAPGAFTLFLDDTPSGTLNYFRLLATPSGVPEDSDTVTVGGGNPVVALDGYIAATYSNRTLINAGIWEFNTYASISNVNQTANIVTDIYIAHQNGQLTYLFSGTSTNITSATPQLVTCVVTAGTYNVTLTDKLVAQYWAISSANPTVNVTMYHSGSVHDSHFHTPIGFAHNDLAGLQGGSSSANQFYHTTLDQNNALTGTSGYPSSTNPFVTLDSLTAEQNARSAADITEQGTRSSADQDLLNRINTVSGSTSYDMLAEQGTRSTADQYLQNQITNLSASSPAFPDVGNRLVSGGNAVWVSGYTFAVGPTVVNFGGTNTTFAGTTFSLPAASVTDDRIDILVADNRTITMFPIVGTASTPAALPSYDPVNQFQLTFIPVSANTTQPANITRTWIYQENVEWAVTVSNATINPNSTNTPFQGSKCIEGTTVLNNQYFFSQAPLAFDPTTYDTVYLYLKPKAGWGTRYLRLNWETSGGARRGNYVSINSGAFGFDINNLNYQLVAIPLSLFGISAGTAVQRLRFTAISSAGSMGFFIDNIAIQVGVTTPSVAVPDATTTTKGIVLLAPSGGVTPATVVQGNDARLALAVAEPGTRSSADQTIQNQVTTNLQTLANEIVVRTNNDNFHQAEIDSLFALLGVGFSGTFAWWMSQIRGGITDTKLNVINGVVAGVNESIMPWEDFEFYGTGSIGSGAFTRGTAWNGAGVLTVSPIPGFIAEETYGGLPQGPVSVIPLSILVGTGWSDAGTIGAETSVGFYGSDAFDSYSVGTVAPGQINGGFNWAGTATITAIP